eukprot:TRINITY_DN113379_c0_g1_i1.p1 TRINITY_DN113379_c0_g1~~TRINITY_DN113379_c0_g1_i1.p1  ORF type:complete len:466 (+),score=85.66 TRINITY_DN113379_c0_g1_i1:140-1537(+)
MAVANGKEESEGPPEAGVAHINAFGKKHFSGFMNCTWCPAKGRILRATREFALGEIILVESPLHIVQEEKNTGAFKKLRALCKKHENDFDYEPLWYWCALQSLTAEQMTGSKVDAWKGASEEVQTNLLLLHHEEVTEPSSAATILVRELCPNCDPITLERLIQIWVLNCFEYSDNPQGYSAYFYSSFMSHSCFPNAVWHYDGSDHVLRARREVKVGDEVCISYLPEDGLLQAAPVRRWELHETKRFWCDCERCAEGLKDGSRGFICPSCKEGQVLANTPPAGPAKSQDFLQAEWAGCSCEKCGHKLTAKQAKGFSDKECSLHNEVKELSDKPSGMTLARARAMESDLKETFTQHVLADLACEQLADFYSSSNYRVDQRRILQRRREFHNLAYPGLSGAHAWTLEAFGDAMLIAGKGAQGTKPESVPVDKPEAAKLYTESLHILTLMFGKDHEYVTHVEEKKKSNL